MLTDKDYTHVILGRSTAGSIKYAFKINRDQCLVSNDPMTIGRQNLSTSLETWQSARHHALKTVLGEDFYNLESDDTSKTDLFDNFHLLHSDKPVLFWADSHISTHAMIAFIVYHAVTNNLDCSRFHIVRFFASDNRLWSGLAVQTPADLIINRPKTRKLTQEDIANYLRFWQIFASDNLPELIQTVSSRALSKSLDVPFGHLLRRLPSRKSGLDVIDEMLLAAAISYAPRAVMAVAHVLGHDDSPDRQDDTYLFQRLLKLSCEQTPRAPLLIGNDYTSLRDCKMTFLPLAHEILAGHANMITLNGLDDWLGGVHLTPDNVVYREDLAAMGGS